jgi:hypothetical protein
MNSGKYVFSQVLEFANKYEFDKRVKRYEGSHRVRELSCWNQFIQLFFGQLASLNSLNDICLRLKARRGQLYHLGIKQNAVVSTLSRANERRDWRIFADFGNHSIRLVRPLHASCPIPGIRPDNEAFAFGSTTLSASVNPFTRAEGRYSRGAAVGEPVEPSKFTRLSTCVEVTGIYLHYRWLLSVVEVRKISRRQCA